MVLLPSHLEIALLTRSAQASLAVQMAEREAARDRVANGVSMAMRG